ncbi:hypothetical protein [Chryseobacterium sp. GVT01B]|uniref:hypothetical protein n=1 Tax=Chryseobacterium sp. GVT01B TaxID=2862675 RepID=UPI001CC09D6E|nr:hypothetical protein [Chryseobacterium sp. GVT01B]
MKYLSIIILLLFINGNAQKMDVKNTSEFVKISKSELKETDLKTLELVDFGKIRNESAPYGDFLSRLYTHFGKPENIMFEGFNYLIRDKQTDIVFLAFLVLQALDMLRKKIILKKLNQEFLNLNSFWTIQKMQIVKKKLKPILVYFCVEQKTEFLMINKSNN